MAGFGPLTHLVRLENGGSDDFYFARPELFFGPTTGSPYPGNGSAITAYDMNSGSILWQVPLGGRPTGSLMTYLDGDRQYIIVTVGRQDELMEMVALALPE